MPQIVNFPTKNVRPVLTGVQSGGIFQLNMKKPFMGGRSIGSEAQAESDIFWRKIAIDGKYLFYANSAAGSGRPGCPFGANGRLFTKAKKG